MFDDQHLFTISEKCASVVINKWLVQVIDNNGVFHSAYFAVPPKGTPSFVHPSKLEALRFVLAQVAND